MRLRSVPIISGSDGVEIEDLAEKPEMKLSVNKT
jgi:hypothetical protein